MIHEVDDALRALVRRDVLRGSSEVDVVFDAPTKDWSTRRGNSPTIDVFLYDVREDVRRREIGRIERREDGGRVIDRQTPPRWFKLSYLVTAWTQRPEDEHLLLSTLLAAFLRRDLLPRELLGGSLADLALPIPMTVAIPPPEDRALSDTWSALGGELKPSLDLVVIAPFDLARDLPAGPPVLESPRLRVGTGVLNPVRRADEAATPAAAGKGTRRRGAAGRAASGDASPDGAERQAGGRAGTPPGEAAAGTAPGRRAEDVFEGGDRPHPGRRFRIQEIERARRDDR
jgi:hypothetical protein